MYTKSKVYQNMQLTVHNQAIKLSKRPKLSLSTLQTLPHLQIAVPKQPHQFLVKQPRRHHKQLIQICINSKLAMSPPQQGHIQNSNSPTPHQPEIILKTKEQVTGAIEIKIEAK